MSAGLKTKLFLSPKHYSKHYLESLSALVRTAFLTAKSRIQENNWWDWQWSPLMPQTNRTVETDWPIQCNIIQCRQVMGSSLVFSLPDLIVMTRREKFSPRLSLYPSKPQGWIVFPWGGDAGVPVWYWSTSLSISLSLTTKKTHFP